MKSQVSFFSYGGSCTLRRGGGGVNSEVNNGLTESGELLTDGGLATYTENPKIPVSWKINGTRRSLSNISELIMGSQSKECSFTAAFGNSSSVMLMHFARYTSSVRTSSITS